MRAPQHPAFFAVDYRLSTVDCSFHSPLADVHCPLLLSDRFGNRWNQTVTTGTGWQVLLSFNGSNQISSSGYQYDAAGNLLMDNFNCYTFDAENRLSSVAPETTPNIERLSDRVIGPLKGLPEGTGEAGDHLETVCLVQRLWAMIQ